MNNDSLGFLVGNSTSDEFYTYCNYTGGARTIDGADSYTGRKDTFTNRFKLGQYVAGFSIQVENVDNGTLHVNSTSSSTYNPDGKTITFPGTLLSVLRDNDFKMSITIDSSQKVIFTTVNPSPRPIAPAGLKATPGDTEVTLEWTNPNNDTITRYQYQQKAGDGSYGNWMNIGESGASTVSHTVSDLTNGTAYAFKIRAIGRGGDGAESNQATATPNVAPAMPVLGEPQPGNAEVKLVWTYTANTAEVANWQYRRKENGTTVWGAWTDINGSNKDTKEYTVTSLQNNTTYDFQVRARTNGGVAGPPSGARFATPAGPPVAATALTATAGGRRATLTWTLEPGDPSIEIWQYQAVRGEFTNEFGFGSATWRPMTGTDATTRSHTVSNLESEVTYSFRIRAVGYGGNGAASDIATATPERDTAPSFGGAAIADRSWSLDRAIRALQLPAASSGNGALSYTLTPDLPAGLSFDASTRQIVGAPTAIQPAATYSWKAADEDGDEATLTFTIAVEADVAPGFGDAAIADRSWSQGRAIRALQLPAASGGNGALSYTLTPDLPAGLSFDASTRQIAGAPTTLQSAASYTYRVADQDNDEATLTFTIAVEADMAPGFGDAAIADRVYAQNAAIDALQLPRATGGNGALSYSISPDLPVGLSFDASMRQIAGAPTTLQSAASYTYRVADRDNDEATLTFTIAVEADTAPSFGDAAIADQSYALDRTIGVLQLPAASGGNGALSYTLTPELPDGLSLDASTRQITGAPTALQEALTYSWRAVDADFNRSGSDAATLSFTIEVTTAEMERRALKHMLAATARATLAGAVDVIGQRFDAAPGGPGLSLAGRRIGGAPPVVDRYRRDRWDRLGRRDDRATPMGYSHGRVVPVARQRLHPAAGGVGRGSGRSRLDGVGPGRLAGLRGPQGWWQLGRRAADGLAGRGCAPGRGADGRSGALAGQERSGLPA